MSYNIAVVSSDQVNINGHFGEAEQFLIIEIDDDLRSHTLEVRPVADNRESIPSGCSAAGQGGGCGGHGSQGGGCGGGNHDPRVEARVNTIKDCRCVLAARCGVSAERQLKKNSISSFQIEMPIEKALIKVISYYDKVDRNLSLRRDK